MDFEIDEERMKKDGVDSDELWQDIENMIKELEGVTYSSRGKVVTRSNGLRSWIMEKLEEMPLYMKYVKKWTVNDDAGIFGDVILVFNEMGVRCCFE